MCGYNHCKCVNECYITKCGTNRKEDKIFDLVFGSMRDKELQREIWRKGTELDCLEKVLNAMQGQRMHSH